MELLFHLVDNFGCKNSWKARMDTGGESFAPGSIEKPAVADNKKDVAEVVASSERLFDTGLAGLEGWSGVGGATVVLRAAAAGGRISSHEMRIDRDAQLRRSNKAPSAGEETARPRFWSPTTSVAVIFPQRQNHSGDQA